MDGTSRPLKLEAANVTIPPVPRYVQEKERRPPPPIVKRPDHYTAFKLIVDPALVKGALKVYRYDGVIPGDASSHMNVIVRDPRKHSGMSSLSTSQAEKKVWILPVPKFKIDANYVGELPSVEVTMTNLDESARESFLIRLAEKSGAGAITGLEICYHPVSHRHLGIAHVVFSSPDCAVTFLRKVNGTYILGKKVHVFLDAHRTEFVKLYDKLVTLKPGKLVVKKNNYSEHGEKCEDPLLDDEERSPKKRGSLESSSETTKKQKTLYKKKKNTKPNKINITENEDCINITKKSDPSPSYNDDSSEALPIPLQDTSSSLVAAETTKDDYTFSSVVSSPYENGSDSLSPRKEIELAMHSIDLDTRIKLMLESSSSGGLGKFLLDDIGTSGSTDDDGNTTDNTSPTKRPKLNLQTSTLWKIGNENGENVGSGKSSFKKFTGRMDNYDTEHGETSSSEDENSFLKNYNMRLSESPPPSPFLSFWERNKAGNDCNEKSTSTQKIENEEAIQYSHSAQPTNVVENPSVASVQLHGYNYDCLEYDSCNSKVNYNDYDVYNMFSYYHSGSNLHWDSAYPPLPPPPPPPPPPPDYPPPPNSSPISSHLNYFNYSSNQGESTNHSKEFGGAVESCANEARSSPTQIIDALLDCVTEELREIFKKDCIRLLIEGESFGMFEEWVKTNEAEYNKKIAEENALKKSVSFSNFDTTPMENHVLSKILENGSSIPQSGFLSIPKLPVFKKKPKPSSPTQSSVDESHKSIFDSDDDENGNKYSSTEEDDGGSSSDENEILVGKKPALGKTRKYFSSSSEAELDDVSSATGSEIDAEEKESNVLSESSVDYNNADSFKITTIPKTEFVKLDEEDKQVFIVEKSQSNIVPETSLDIVVSNNVVKSPLIIPTELTKSKSTRKSWKIRSESSQTFPPWCDSARLYLLYHFQSSGLDEEDFKFLKDSYETLRSNKSNATVTPLQKSCIEVTPWVEHPPTTTPVVQSLQLTTRSKKSRSHSTSDGEVGSLRTRGFVRQTRQEKMLEYQKRLRRKSEGYWKTASICSPTAENCNLGTQSCYTPTGLTKSRDATLRREVKLDQRRLLTVLGTESDFLKINQLKFRRKSLRFSRSAIHEWGLFAAEPIVADEMIIEYVGQVIRPVLADFREKLDQARNPGCSSYLFCVDPETIIDALKCGNLSRFINHSCNPNCYAKVITFEGKKKIVIYSKRDIAVDEEITYDYKFPKEDVKIPCLCGASGCRGTLN